MLVTDGPIAHLRRRLLHDNVLTFSQWQALMARIEEAGLILVDRELHRTIIEAVKAYDWVALNRAARLLAEKGEG